MSKDFLKLFDSRKTKNLRQTRIVWDESEVQPNKNNKKEKKKNAVEKDTKLLEEVKEVNGMCN
ncbi:hypothetical protein RUM43_011371 [Polyplax serrata]|uniref:Uncharacterized protein n=1 Tax=Polyplax serrata TaxID=468196 RepID=A0AAN8PF17_POLSC